VTRLSESIGNEQAAEKSGEQWAARKVLRRALRHARAPQSVMTILASRTLSAWLVWLTLAALGTFVAAYLVVAFARIRYPFDVDFLEDAELIKAWRMAQGLPVFLPPNADFVPSVYTPLFGLLSAGLLRLSGVGYVSIRLLSFAATLTTASLLLWAGLTVSRRRIAALISPGLFFVGYTLTGAQYELARVDPLFITLSVAGTLLGIVGAHSRRWVALSALCLALAFFTKQAALMFVAGMAIYLVAINRKRALAFALLSGFFIVIPLILMDRTTNGVSTYYFFNIPAYEPVLAGRLVNFVRVDLLQSFGPMCFCAVALAYVILRGRSNPFSRAWLFFTLLALIDSGLQRGRAGGYLNTLMPAYTFLCLMPTLLWHELSAAPVANRMLRSSLRDGVYLVILWQCVIGTYNPLSEIPTAAMQQSGDRLIQRIAQAQGPVLVLEHPSYALMAGKAPGVALTMLWHARKQGLTPLPADLTQRIQGKYYSAIFADDGEYPEVEAEVKTLVGETYTLGTLLTERDAPPTLTGLVVRPAQEYVAKP
jgi:hypothetical protein